MAAVGSYPSANAALDAGCSVPSTRLPFTPPPATVTNFVPTQQPSRAPPRLLLRLPETSPDSARNPLKRKWRSLVNFFALPIRAYYLEPPGHAYRARRSPYWNDDDDGLQPSFWPVPAYTDQVGDDEMVLFKAQEEAEAIAAAHAEALRREQQREEQAEEEGSPGFDDAFSDVDEEEDEEQEEQLPSSIPRFASPLPAEPSPMYELRDPFSAVDPPAPARPARNPARPIRIRTSASNSNLAPPSFTNGQPMARHLSTPLSPSSPSSPPTPSSLFARRSRAQSNASRPRPSLSDGRTISEPLSWTLVRSQYSYPKRGLTPQQLSFLSSVESLGRFGVQSASPAAGEHPSPAYDGRAAGATDYGFPRVSMGA